MNSFWAQRSPSERRMIILGLIVIVVGLPFALIPPGGGGKGLLSSAQARQQYGAKIKEKSSLDADLDRIDPLMKQMVYTDAPEKLIPTVIKTLQDHAKASGIHLREIKPLRSRKAADMIKETLSVRFTSEFSKAVPFFYRVEDPDGKLVVEKFNLTASDPKLRTVDVDAQIALYTHGGSQPTGTSTSATPSTAASSGT